MANRNEIEREARRVLRHMEGCVLEARGQAFVLAGKPGGKARLTLDTPMLAAFVTEGWIAPKQAGRYEITDQGRAFVIRQAARAEPFRAQHGEIEDLGGGVRVERAGSALEALGRMKDEAGRPYLNGAEREAAVRLEADFERLHLRPRLTRDLSLPPGGAPEGGLAERLTASALDARTRVLDALDAAGPGLKDMLFETVCLSHGLNETERVLGWPQRSGKAVVRLGLQRLASHYGLSSGQRRPGRIEAWMASIAGEAA